MRKPKEGVCGYCGRAVVRLEKPKPGWSNRITGTWLYEPYGHLRDDNLKLIKVVCFECAYKENVRVG